MKILSPIWFVFYDLLWTLLLSGIKILPKNSKLRIWHWEREKQQHIKGTTLGSSRILFACASVGEFLRIKTLATHYSQKGYEVEISFFSPSGYQYFQKLEISWAHIVSYLPIDRSWDVALFFDRHPIDYVVISSNMIWPQFIRALTKRHISYSIVGCSYHPSGWPKKLFYQWVLPILHSVDQIFCIDDQTLQIIHDHLPHTTIYVIGDPRLNLLLIEKADIYENATVSAFKQQYKLLIIGSAYSKELEMLISIWDEWDDQNLKVLIAPHNLSHIGAFQQLLEKNKLDYCLYSSCRSNSQIMILDQIGILRHIYKYGDIVIVGGGWGDGLHNIVEPLVYDNTIIIGPGYEKYPEARYLVENQAITKVNDEQELLEAITTHDSLSFQKNKRLVYQQWIENNRSANQRVIEHLNL